MIYRYKIFVLLLLLNNLFATRGSAQLLVSDTFNSPNDSWEKIVLNSDETGQIQISGGRLVIKGREGYFGIYNKKPISGHFIVDIDFVEDNNIGLALLQSKDGRPDISNYTMLCVDKQQDFVVVDVRDCQNGVRNVLDHTGKTNFSPEKDEQDIQLNIGSDLYKHVLTGKQYSLPFTETSKTVRIFRDDNADFFHYYYKVSKVNNGEKYTDWSEIRPSPDWAKEGTEYFIALVSLHEGQTVITKVEAEQKPVADKDDRSTGFSVTKREYNWSGFIGNAYVVTFDETFPYHNNDIKFTFWTEMNYIPAWHLNNQLLYTYEFVETWDDNVAGCHEPMSDRVRQWTRVQVLEDNDVRKVLRWHYVLCNPNYQVPAQGQGSQLPEVDEYWTFYPDGSGTRHIIYTPKMDSDFRAPHELGELISIAGSKAHSSDFYDSPALTMMNLAGDIKKAHPGPKFDYYSDMDDWSEQILRVHFEKEPDVFCVWSHNPDFAETYSGYPIRYENAWQNPHGKIVHWPVNKRPYTSAYAAGGTWKGEASHACLLSWGVRDGSDWNDHFKVHHNGRKYREWVSLVGLNEKYATQEVLKKTRTWLFKGKIKTNQGVEYLEKDYQKNSFVFETTSTMQNLELRFIPEQREILIYNPVLQIKNWEAVNEISVSIDGRLLDTHKYRKTWTKDNIVLIWINAQLGADNKLVIQRL